MGLAALLVGLSGLAVVIGAATRPAATAAPDATASAAVTSGTAAPGPTPSARPPAAAQEVGDGGLDAGDPGATCHIPDEGLGRYRPWQRLSTGAVLLPRAPPGPTYDLLVHFHGAEAIRKVLAPAGLPVVIAALDAGEGSAAYGEAFYGPDAIDELIEEVATALEGAVGQRPKLHRLIVSSWSAGYGAVRQLLIHHPGRAQAVVLLDSLHTSYVGGEDELETDSLQPFVELAQRAAGGEQQLVITHSEIRPPGFASTAETASYLLRELGGQRRYAGLRSVAGIEHKTEYRQNGLVIRGYTGTSRDAHCAHLILLRDILRDELLGSDRTAPRDGG